MQGPAVIEHAQAGRSRRHFLLGGLLGGAAVAGTLRGIGGPAGAQRPSRAQDERILNFALGLEYLQAAFYAEAESRGALTGELAEFASVVGEQERAHVERLQELLGSAARPEPELSLGEVVASEDAFLDAAVALEDTGVFAYIGQGANLTLRSVAAVAPLVSVEARHAAWILDLAGRDPAPVAADPALGAAEARARLEQAGLTLPEG